MFFHIVFTYDFIEHLNYFLFKAILPHRDAQHYAIMKQS